MGLSLEELLDENEGKVYGASRFEQTQETLQDIQQKAAANNTKGNEAVAPSADRSTNLSR